MQGSEVRRNNSIRRRAGEDRRVRLRGPARPHHVDHHCQTILLWNSQASAQSGNFSLLFQIFIIFKLKLPNFF